MPKLTVVRGSTEPNLGKTGLSLWNRVQGDYAITDVGGLETLFQICAAADRAAELSALIDRDGAIIRTKTGLKEHPALRGELAARSFVVRMLARLGLTVEAVKPVGKPPNAIHWSGEDDNARRIPLEHARRPRFIPSEEALRLYTQMRSLKCSCPPRTDDMPYFDAPDECPQCLEWAQLNRRLAPHVGLPLHETCCVPPPNPDSSFLREEEEKRQRVLEQALAGREAKS